MDLVLKNRLRCPKGYRKKCFDPKTGAFKDNKYKCDNGYVKMCVNNNYMDLLMNKVLILNKLAEAKRKDYETQFSNRINTIIISNIDKNDTMSDCQKELEKTIILYKDTLEKLNEKSKEYETLLNTSNDKITKLTTELEEKTELIETEKKSLADTKAIDLENIKVLEDKINILTNGNIEKDSIIKKLQDEKEKIKKSLAKCNKKIEQLKRDNKQQFGKLESIEKLREERNSLEISLKECRELIETLKNDIKDKDNIIDDLTGLKNKLETSIDESNAKIAELSNKIGILETQAIQRNQEILKEKEEYESKLSQIKFELEATQQQLKEEYKKGSELENDKKALEESLKILQKKYDEAMTQLEEYGDMEDKDEKIIRLNNLVVEKEAELIRRLGECDEELNSLKDRYKNQNDIIAKLNNELDELRPLKNVNIELQAINIKMKEEIDRLKKEIDITNEEKKETIIQLTEMSNEIEREYKARIESIEEGCKTKIESFEGIFNDNMNTINSLQRELKKARDQVTSCEVRRNKLELTVKDQEKRLKRKQEELENLQEMIN